MNLSKKKYIQAFMNVEIQTQSSKPNGKCEFTFSKNVNHYIVGYSYCKIQFDSLDHHVREISIDLRSSSKNGKKVTVEPRIQMRDHSGHQESKNSKIDIVVLATVGNGNQNLELHTNLHSIEGIADHAPDNNNAFIDAALSYSEVKYDNNEDHHLLRFLSYVYPCLSNSVIGLKAGTSIIDGEKNFKRGNTFGNVIIHNMGDRDILCARFDSKKIGKAGQISLGLVPQGARADNYIIGSFINSFTLSFAKPEDHHVKYFEINCSLNRIFINNGELTAKIELKSYVTDRHSTGFDVPQNEIAGFLIAVKKY